MGWAPLTWAVGCHVTICDRMARYYLQEEKSSLLVDISPNPLIPRHIPGDIQTIFRGPPFH
jgi:hypothetical protein